MRNAKQGLDELSRPGPLTVLRGDLGMSGIPGVIYAPEEGLGLPAVAFGHDWLQPPARYADLLRHLASWGFVRRRRRATAGRCPATRASPPTCAARCRSASACGSGTGGSAWTPGAPRSPGTASGAERRSSRRRGSSGWRRWSRSPLAQTHPSALEAARKLTVPVLHLAAGKDLVAPPAGHAEQIALSAGGPVILRTLPKASHTGFLDGRHWSDALLAGSPDGKVRRLTRALVTAFLMRHLCDEDRVDPLVEGKIPGTTLPEPQRLNLPPASRIRTASLVSHGEPRSRHGLQALRLAAANQARRPGPVGGRSGHAPATRPVARPRR